MLAEAITISGKNLAPLALARLSAEEEIIQSNNKDAPVEKGPDLS